MLGTEAFNTAKVFALHGNSGRESNHAQEFLPHLVFWPLRPPRPDHAPRKPRSPRGTQPHPGIPSCALPPKPLRRTTTCGWREAGQAKTKENPKKTKERKQRSPATRRDSFLCPTPLANAAYNHVRLEGGRPGQTKERPKKTKKTKKHRRGIYPRDSFLCPAPLAIAAYDHVQPEGRQARLNPEPTTLRDCVTSRRPGWPEGSNGLEFATSEIKGTGNQKLGSEPKAEQKSKRGSAHAVQRTWHDGTWSQN